MSQGIIFAGYFLNKEEFKIIFKKWLQEYLVDFIEELTGPNGIITKNGNLRSGKSKQEIFFKWESLQKEYFKNPEVTLIAAVKLKGPNSKDYTWTRNVPERKALSEMFLNLGTDEMSNALLSAADSEAALELNQQMNEHYEKLLKLLKDDLIDEKEIAQLSNYYKSKNRKDLTRLASRIGFQEDVDKLKNILNQNSSNLNHPFRNVMLSKILYGATISDSGVISGGMSGAAGKIQDAYMNHIGGHHREVFDWFTNISKIDKETIKDKFKKHKGIKAEERDNFIPLLTGGMNTTPWFAGGDIVVYGDDRKIVYNIQLKTTVYKSQTYHIATTKLRKVLRLFLNYANSDDKNTDLFAEKIFEALKNDSANFSKEFDEAVNRSIIEKVSKEMGLQIK